MDNGPSIGETKGSVRPARTWWRGSTRSVESGKEIVKRTESRDARYRGLGGSSGEAIPVGGAGALAEKVKAGMRRVAPTLEDMNMGPPPTIDAEFRDIGGGSMNRTFTMGSDDALHRAKFRFASGVNKWDAKADAFGKILRGDGGAGAFRGVAAGAAGAAGAGGGGAEAAAAAAGAAGAAGSGGVLGAVGRVLPWALASAGAYWLANQVYDYTEGPRRQARENRIEDLLMQTNRVAENTDLLKEEALSRTLPAVASAQTTNEIERMMTERRNMSDLDQLVAANEGLMAQTAMNSQPGLGELYARALGAMR